MNIALIVFAGKGTRIHSQIPKQFIRIDKKEIVAYTIETFQHHPLIDEIILVTSADYLPYTQNLTYLNHFDKVINIVEGGETRQESVRKGLLSIKANDKDNVLIHDGDRPLVSHEIITRCLRELAEHDACTVAIKSDEALTEVKNLGRKYHLDGVDYDIQTPQCFKFGLIRDAHIRLCEQKFVDDASLIIEMGKDVSLVEGDKYNFKVTTDQDLEFLRKELVIRNQIKDEE
ncbi:MAG: 2-C-methyl-D-erythritol 4-phosphate cytidylyltransferase [Bacilli bacterium]|nr:2-C-methyl-D-erythritol 4-phosphate cytidylyltransferase [Bacilli bacterium]